MYHAIVKRIALQNFLRVNQKDYTPILKGCSPDIHHRFGGHHALGGERHDREALRRWFERLGRLAPTLQLTVHDVWVKGGPWNTTVIMRWSAAQDLPDGSPYNNHGVHIIRMRWGLSLITHLGRLACATLVDAQANGGDLTGLRRWK